MVNEDEAVIRVNNEVKVLNIDGHYIPFKNGRPLPAKLIGAKDPFLMIFSDMDKLIECCTEYNLPYDDVKKITDGKDFIASLEGQFRVALDAHKHENGRLRFLEVMVPKEWN